MGMMKRIHELTEAVEQGDIREIVAGIESLTRAVVRAAAERGDILPSRAECVHTIRQVLEDAGVEPEEWWHGEYDLAVYAERDAVAIALYVTKQLTPRQIAHIGLAQAEPNSATKQPARAA